MSYGYGFLTESTIIPKKSKQIKINDNSGQLLLESIIQKQKERLKNGGKVLTKDNSNRQPKRNAGIEQRIKRDEDQAEKNRLVEKNYYKCLEKKAEIYQKINSKKQNVEKLLVDFESKQDNIDQNQLDEYQKAREAFYSGEIRNIQSHQKRLHSNIQADTSSTNMMRQRLAWQKQMLSQMKGSEAEGSRPKVIQSFDHKLSKEQHDALDKVISEQQNQKIKLEGIRRRKILQQQEKIRKLRKLNNMRDVLDGKNLVKSQVQPQKTNQN